MSVIERATKALANAQSRETAWDGLDEALQEQFRSEVRAVIRALREPAPDMGFAGQPELKAWGHDADADVAISTWGTMIDTLLTTGGTTVGDG
jgi:ABC-type branched-subunit amino acid transport system substrate-binding protein